MTISYQSINVKKNDGENFCLSPVCEDDDNNRCESISLIDHSKRRKEKNKNSNELETGIIRDSFDEISDNFETDSFWSGYENGNNLSLVLLSAIIFIVGLSSGVYGTSIYYSNIYNSSNTQMANKEVDLFETQRKALSMSLLLNSPPTSTNTDSSSSLSFLFSAPTSTPRPLLYLTNADAYQRLLDGSPSSMQGTTFSQYSSDFFLISSGIDAQINQAYCGTATAVAIINSLRFLRIESKNGVSSNPVLDVPVDNVYAPYPYATQKDIFNNCTKALVIKHTGGGPGVDDILTPPYGLSMPQLSNLLQCHLNSDSSNIQGYWVIESHYVDNTHLTVGKMTFDIKNAIADPNSRVLVNYDRATAGQIGGGHWSPVGSYCELKNSFLIIDVAKYKYPPVWIPAERLFSAMATYDSCGTWNFPDGQDTLTPKERFMSPDDGSAYDDILKKLGCQSTLRGYIIVTWKS
eukprot:CAMPEP_0184865062 /NCGR_PEP_ID=MMETSP0580-20130426/16839_1 /TAXON_ID=1118495 /ORGANISM="Dactyliosolen fragilissimus" /LENGTH=462 /DNA_ID=CAMNT_0027364083 /DNA_START=457 /DNA_END=1845 /DNA_ORIENTATION=-